MQDFVYVINQAGRDALRDGLAGVLAASIDPERYADAASDEAEVVVADGVPEISVEIRAMHNIHSIPWTITIAGAQFFNAEQMDA